MKSKLSPFDQAQKNVWECILKNPKVPKWKRDALLVLFGNLSFKVKLSKIEKVNDLLYAFDVERTINEISRLMEDSEDLKQVWMLNRPTFINSLAIL